MKYFHSFLNKYFMVSCVQLIILIQICMHSLRKATPNLRTFGIVKFHGCETSESKENNKYIAIEDLTIYVMTLASHTHLSFTSISYYLDFLYFILLTCSILLYLHFCTNNAS